jgi:hypothetical protein
MLAHKMCLILVLLAPVRAVLGADIHGQIHIDGFPLRKALSMSPDQYLD